MRSMSLALAALALALSGCANFNSINRVKSGPSSGKGQIFTVDAKQRHLIMSRVGTGDMRVCAEAAPDVFSAFATSFAGQGDNAGGQLSLSSNEVASTIERTQTINMLRESFYRTCERYLSGAITKTQFVVQAARDQRSMITILAVEQLTGVARGKSTIISPGGTASSVLSGEKAAELIREYDQRLETAKSELKTAELAREEASDGVCSESTGEDSKADPEKCAALDAALAGKKSNAEKAQKALDDVMSIAKDLVQAGAASTVAGSTLQGGGEAHADAVRAIGVSHAIVEIVKLASIDEPLMFCLGHLNDPQSLSFDRENTITKNCMTILIARANADLKTRGDTGLDFAAAAEFGRGFESAIEAKQLMAEIEYAILAAPNAELTKRMEAFEAAAMPISLVSSGCTDSRLCVELVRSAYPIDMAERIDAYRNGLNAFNSWEAKD